VYKDNPFDQKRAKKRLKKAWVFQHLMNIQLFEIQFLEKGYEIVEKSAQK
jgi:hypothetical protein